jgi:hypothetical protein
MLIIRTTGSASVVPELVYPDVGQAAAVEPEDDDARISGERAVLSADGCQPDDVHASTARLRELVLRRQPIADYAIREPKEAARMATAMLCRESGADDETTR